MTHAARAVLLFFCLSLLAPTALGLLGLLPCAMAADSAATMPADPPPESPCHGADQPTDGSPVASLDDCCAACGVACAQPSVAFESAAGAGTGCRPPLAAGAGDAAEARAALPPLLRPPIA